MYALTEMTVNVHILSNLICSW